MGSEASTWQGMGADLLAVSLTTMVLVLIGILIWQVSKTYQTRMAVNAHVAQEAAYRALAERSTHAQEQATAQLALLQEQTATLNSRVASIERLLKDVA